MGTHKKKLCYDLDPSGSFVIEDYNQQKPFSNFFPGVAGVWGIPMWAFYVNRGQCVSSFGIESKDKAILEFQPANKAYRLTPLQGFRTFLKVRSGTKVHFWEPFQPASSQSAYQTNQRLLITSHDLTIQDDNKSLGLSVQVNYFTIPHEAFPALVREVKVVSLSTKKYEIEVIDGLPNILAYGMKDWLVKNMSRTVEAWIRVANLQKRVPYYHLNVEVADTSDVRHIEEGNFFLSYESGAAKSRLLAPLVEVESVFGACTDFRVPEKFLQQKVFTVPKNQQTANRTPSAMAYGRFSLPGGKEKRIVSVFGQTHSQRHLSSIIKRVTTKDFIEEKRQQNEEEIARIKSFAFTHSSSSHFNGYCGQTFLDNVLRGGLPVSLKTREGNVVFNVFSRKHGDLERDYNHFVLASTGFSQGNGNFRDVVQNRRNDVFFNQDVEENSIVNFFSLLQADGYNPLIVKGMNFILEDQKTALALLEDCVQGEHPDLHFRLTHGFQPGELLLLLERYDIKLKVLKQDFFNRVLSSCRKFETADHGEGFWVDHWTYCLDLIESYLMIYPERLESLLFGTKRFAFYHNSHYVLPREQRYQLTPKGVRQYHSVKDGRKEILAEERGSKLRTRLGEGEVYETTLMTKLLCLIANKAASFDPSGVGIEMEADKPGWCDSLNGLPGLLGASICESLELQRICQFLLQSFAKLPVQNREVLVFSELAVFIKALTKILIEEREPFPYWSQASDVKEKYREQVRKGIDGAEQPLTMNEIIEFLQWVVTKTNAGVKSVEDDKGLFPTYVYQEVTKHKCLDPVQEKPVHVWPQEFKTHRLPYFLEGFVHAFKVIDDQEQKRVLYQRIKKSLLFDQKLRMYKVNADVSKQSEEIGRSRNFPRGWLENESIWLHMEYKYLLELLRSGLYPEFYETFRDCLVPFSDPQTYGRSILENSSFIVSSAHEDEKLHGQGFVARLSGSTAEFMHIWILMNVGLQPFFIDQKGKLALELKPALDSSLFTVKEEIIRYRHKDKGWQNLTLPKRSYAFNFLGSVLTVYHNPSGKNTFGPNKATIQRIELTYTNRRQPVKIEGSVIPSPHAEDIRSHKVDRIEAFF